MDLSERASYLQIFMYHFNANQKASTNKKSLYNQMDKMDRPTDNLPFFLTTFVLICNGPMITVALVAGMGAMLEPTIWTLSQYSF